MTPTTTTSPLGPDGIVRCFQHGEPVKTFVSHTLENPNRPFYVCSQPTRCKFWFWASDPLFNQPPPGLQTPPSSAQSNKRTAPPNTNDTPSKRTRLEAIQAGLRDRKEEQDTLPCTDGAEKPHRYSFLGLPPTQESQPPSTPKKRTSSSELFGLRAPSPQSSHTLATGSQSSMPVTPTKNKGKQRADLFAPAHVDEEHNPFYESSFPSRLQLDSDQYPSQGRSTGERIAINLESFRVALHKFRTSEEQHEQSRTHALDSLAASVNTFELLSAAEYIQRLERQKSALEVRDEAKTKRIAALIERNGQPCRCDELTEKVSRLEERCRAKDKIIASLTGLDGV